MPAQISPASATYYYGFERPGCGLGNGPTNIKTTGSLQLDTLFLTAECLALPT